MQTYLVKATYAAEGFRALQKDTAAGRVKAITQAIESLGGKVHCLYFMCGSEHLVGIIEAPSMVEFATMQVAVNSSGLAQTDGVQLLSVAEMDSALRASVAYRPPGA